MTCDLDDRLPFGIWRVDTDRGPDSRDLVVTDCSERDRSRRFLRECDRNSFLKTRAALRRILGRLIGTEPEEICFQADDWGKPRLAGSRANEISFSVSHTDGLAVIAISDGRKIGVDVERSRVVADRGQIATNVFGASVARTLSRLHDEIQDGAFLRLWTAGEAFVKANGTGFAGLEERIPVSLSDCSGDVRLNSRSSPENERPWSLLSLSLPSGFVGSMVIEGVSGCDGAIVPRSMDLFEM